MTSPNLPMSIQQAHQAAPGAPQADPDVGAILQLMRVARNLTGQELEEHIRDCENLWKLSYARFHDLANPADRDEALLWLQCMNEAILMRAPAVQDRIHEQFWGRR